MNVVFNCPCCGSEIEGDAELGGGTAQCPSCSETILVPAAGIGEGSELGGYRIERVLGCGGMGEVFLATQIAMDRKVALKVLPPAMTKSQESVDRFLHEVRMAAKLEHPNIVTAFDAGEDSGYYYLAMSYVEGEDLYDRLDREGPLPERDGLIIALDVAEALGYAWKKHKILHRDIKPANVMIDVVGDVRLMDMGIAKSIAEDSNLTMAGMYVGTPFYMSPEQCRAESDLDCRSDVYSLGATLYHLLTGGKPFTAPSSMAVLAAHLTQPLASPRGPRPDLSVATEHLICRMMAKERDSRYADWDELIADLRLILDAPDFGALSLPALPDPLPVGGKGASDDTPATLVAQLSAVGDVPEVPELAPVEAPVADSRPEPSDVPSDTVPGLKPAVRADTEAPLPPSPSMESPSPVADVEVDAEPLDYRPDPKVWSKALAAMVVIVILFFAVAGGIFAYNSVGRNRAEQHRADREQVAGSERADVAAVEGAIAYQQTRAELAARTEEQEEKIREMMAAAEAYHSKNPDDLQGALDKFQAIEPFAKGTGHQIVLSERLTTLRGLREDAPKRLMARLRKEAGALSKQWAFSAAIELCQRYAGPLAEETRAERQALASELLRRRGEVDRAVLVAAGGVRSVAALNVVGIQNGIVEVERQSGWHSNPDLKATSVGLRAVLSRLRAFSQSFEADVGKELTLGIDGREGKWRIRGVSDFSVRADANGRTRSLSPANFSARVLLARSKADDAGYRAIKAVLAAGASRDDVTRRELAQIGDSFFVYALAGECVKVQLGGAWASQEIGSRFALSADHVDLKIGVEEGRGVPSIIGRELLILDGNRKVRSRWQLDWQREEGTLLVQGASGKIVTFRRK